MQGTQSLGRSRRYALLENVGSLLLGAANIAAWLVRVAVLSTVKAAIVFVPVVITLAVLFPQPPLYKTPIAQDTLATLIPAPLAATRSSVRAEHKKLDVAWAKALLHEQLQGGLRDAVINAPFTPADLLTYRDLDYEVAFDQREYYAVLFGVLVVLFAISHSLRTFAYVETVRL